MAYSKKKHRTFEKRRLRSRKQVTDMLDTVRYTRQPYVITERGKPLAKVLPVTGTEEIVNRKRRSA